MVETTHDRTLLRIAPVFQPSIPAPLGVLVAGLAAPVGGVLFLVAAGLGWDLGPLDYVSCILGSVGLATSLGLVVTGTAWRLTVHAVRIHLSARRLRVTWEGGVRPALELPLATVRAVELDGSVLVLVTDSGIHRVRIPGRSTRTREAVGHLVRGVRAAIEPRAGDPRDVPAALRCLRERTSPLRQ